MSINLGIPERLTCLLRILYAGQEATVRTGHETTDWLQIGKGVRQDYILSPCLFNLYAEYIMRNVGLEEAQAGIKIAGRNINNLRYADDTTERVTGKKARGLQTEERGCTCQTFLSLLRGRKKQTSDLFFLLYTNLKEGFS